MTDVLSEDGVARWYQDLEDDNWGDAADAWRADRAALLAALLAARRGEEDAHSLRERVALLEGVIRECRKCEQAALHQVEGMEEET